MCLKSGPSFPLTFIDLNFFFLLITGGEFHVQVVDMNTNYSFEVFVCLAVLKEYRKKLLNCLEVSTVYNAIHR